MEYIASYLLPNDELWIVMEFCGGGCLTDILEQFESGIRLNESHIAFVCREVPVCTCNRICARPG